MNCYKTHYVTENRPKFTGESGKLFVELFADKTLRRLAQLHYVEGYSFNQCAEIMNYSERHIQRLHPILKDIAIDELMKLASSGTTIATKILQIKNILAED